MPDVTTTGLLTEQQAAALWEEVDQLRNRQDAIGRRLKEIDDLLTADLTARTGFPREKSA